MKKLYYTCIDDDIPKDTFDKSSANFDKHTPDSTLSIVPVLDTKTGTVIPTPFLFRVQKQERSNPPIPYATRLPSRLI